MSDPARRIGLLTLVEVGSTCLWSSTRVDRYGSPVGGVVQSIDDSVDPETGDMERHYVVLDLHNTAQITVHRLAESEISLQNGVEGADAAPLVALIRRLARELYDQGKPPQNGRPARSSAFLSTTEARYVGWMQSMVAALVGKGSLTPTRRDG